jgi:hypothetical protein
VLSPPLCRLQKVYHVFLFNLLLCFVFLFFVRVWWFGKRKPTSQRIIKIEITNNWIRGLDISPDFINKITLPVTQIFHPWFLLFKGVYPTFLSASFLICFDFMKKEKYTIFWYAQKKNRQSAFFFFKKNIWFYPIFFSLQKFLQKFLKDNLSFFWETTSEKQQNFVWFSDFGTLLTDMQTAYSQQFSSC